MLCPKCNNELVVDHIKTVEIDGVATTSYYYTCLNPKCEDYLKIINGDGKGKIKEEE